MRRKKVIILGCTGMLGSMLLRMFAGKNNLDVKATYRNVNALASLKRRYPSIDYSQLDVEKASLRRIVVALEGAEWVVNAIGLIKPYIHDDNPDEINRAIRVNALFPHTLSKAVQETGSHVLQIATDCVYSGQKGQYRENDPHDCQDVYGKTKSLGEVFESHYYHLRCSIIGPEVQGHYSLLDWLLKHQQGAHINGFINHRWNGITTLQFARICLGIITNRRFSLSHVQHVVPADSISKADLLRLIAKEYKRDDLTVRNVQAPFSIDRTLSTHNTALNRKLWQMAGYDNPPTMEGFCR